MDRSKELNRERKGELNLLLLRQSYLIKKIQYSSREVWSNWQADLIGVQARIQVWYSSMAEKVKHQSKLEYIIMRSTRNTLKSLPFLNYKVIMVFWRDTMLVQSILKM